MAETTSNPVEQSELQDVSNEAVSLVRHWLTESALMPRDKSAEKLAGVLKDPRGLPFTVGFIDGVVRPEDTRVAARNFAELANDIPSFLPWYLRTAIRLGGIAGLALPRIVIPIVRRALRSMVSHLIVDATDAKLGRAIARIRRNGARLNVNLLGEAVLGEREASRRLEGTHRLLARDDVDYVSIKVSSTVAPHPAWAFEEAVDHVVASLTPLFEQAVAAPQHKFINLDMEEYRDLDLTIAVFTTILDRPEFLDLKAGIVLQAYLPDALDAMMRLQKWSAARRARGGAGIKVRIVKGANLPMERVEASIHDWPLATWGSKQDTDTNYKRVIDYSLHPDRVENVRIGVAGHNLFDLAFAWLLATKRGVQHGMEFEMLLGMAQGQAEAVKKDVGGLLLYTPVVHPAEFDVAIAYLIRRLEEGASQDNFMSAVFDLHENEALFEREKDRFLASLEDFDRAVPLPNRSQDRSAPSADTVPAKFRNTPDTDPSLPANRAWGRAILERVGTSTLGLAAVEDTTLTSADALDDVIGTATASASSWAALTGAERGDILNRAGLALERHRADLIEVMAAECGKTLDQADPEVSEAIDFAHFYAARAAELDTMAGATFVPASLTVVTPPWNFPVAIPAGSTLAALAAGSSVVIKPAPQARRCGAVMVEALWEAGVPRDVLHLVQVEDSSLGEQLVSDPRVDRVILTGGYETAELFRSFRPDLSLLAETSGKNAIIVTPSADLDLAAKDVAQSAFGHAGQKCSAASLVILVGSVGSSPRFRHQLVDAVTSLKVGMPSDPRTFMGPIIEPAHGKLLGALTTLAPGESWLVEPKKLDEEGRLWSPGVRDRVARGSHFHLTEFFGPVLGIIRAETLAEAIEIQNQVDYGLTTGLHSLDPDEVELWLDQVQAGNLYVNRGITGAIVQRQPFGGWKKSAVGAGAKAGGPNYLFGLGSWESATDTTPEQALVAPVEQLLQIIAQAGSDPSELAFLRRSANSDALAWRTEFAAAKDVSKLTAERNIFRYRAMPVGIRLAEGAPVHHLVRVVAAATLAGSRSDISVGSGLAEELSEAIGALGFDLITESDLAWAERIRNGGSRRIRLIGGDVSEVMKQTDGRPDLALFANPVTEAGRLELLPFLHEQSVSITAHRFGTPHDILKGTL